MIGAEAVMPALGAAADTDEASLASRCAPGSSQATDQYQRAARGLGTPALDD